MDEKVLGILAKGGKAMTNYEAMRTMDKDDLVEFLSSIMDCYFKDQIISQAEAENAQIPQEVYWAIPPIMPKTYMVKSGKYYLRYKKWDNERVSKIVLRADTDMALF